MRTSARARGTGGIADGDDDGGRCRHHEVGQRIVGVLAVAAVLLTAGATVPVLAQSNVAPTAGFQYSPSDPAVNETVTFTATASDTDGSVASHEWFVDGTVTSTDDSFSHAFSQSGDHRVRLTVTDDDGATSDAIQTVAVTGDTGGLSVSIDYTPSDPRAGTTVTFEVDASETASSYVWRFGDGNSGSGQFASHSYGSPGTYTVELVAEDEDARATATTDVEVVSGDPGAPRVSIEYAPESPSAGREVTFDARASDPDGSIEAYDWRIDGVSVGSGSIYRHTFDEGGQHDIAVTVTDTAGLTANASTSISVADDNARPTATIDYDPLVPSAGETVTLTAEAEDSDGAVARYDWTVDGTAIGSGASVKHTFEAEGDATVELTVTDDDGASVTTETTIGIGPAQNDGDGDGNGTEENGSGGDGADDGGGEGMPGFTAVAAAAGLVAVAFLRGATA